MDGRSRNRICVCHRSKACQQVESWPFHFFHFDAEVCSVLQSISIDLYERTHEHSHCLSLAMTYTELCRCRQQNSKRKTYVEYNAMTGAVMRENLGTGKELREHWQRMGTYGRIAPLVVRNILYDTILLRGQYTARLRLQIS